MTAVRSTTVFVASSTVVGGAGPGAARTLRLGTRASTLALVQAREVLAGLAEAGMRAEIVTVETAGDRRPPDSVWGEGAFVSAIERALRDGEVDAAVHSAKDLPTRDTDRLTIAAWLPRADARDALITSAGGATLAGLPRGARVGTDSPRRTAFLLAARPDLRPHLLNGNVDTRLRRLDAGETDALCLAVAGLTRLGRETRIDEVLGAEVALPAPGQGAIAVQVRSDDRDAARALAYLDHAPTRHAVQAERAFLRESGGGCRAPIGAHATVDDDGTLVLRGLWARPDGTAIARDEVRGAAMDAERLGAELARRLRRAAPGLARAVRAVPRVLLTRADGDNETLREALGEHDIDSSVVPAIAVDLVSPGGPLDDAVRELGRYAWVVITSANGARAIADALARTRCEAALGTTRWAAIGPATAAALESRHIPVAYRPQRSNAAAMAESLPLFAGEAVLLARADIADGRLPAALRERGAEVHEVVAYRTIEAPLESAPLLDAALDGPRPDALVFTSGSTVRGLLTLAGDRRAADVRSIPAVCIGPGTAAEALRQGFRVAGQAPMQTAVSLADVIAATLRRIA